MTIRSKTRVLHFLVGVLWVLLFGEQSLASQFQSRARRHQRRSALQESWNGKVPVDAKSVASLVAKVHGGGQEVSSSQKTSKNVKTVVLAGSTIVSSWLLWRHREGWMALFDKEKLQAKTLDILHGLSSYPKYQSYIMYTLAMAIWETGGLSTIPVETAAGMVFGWDGLYLSASGKVLGAVVAFCLGRYGILANWVQEKLGKNEVLQLMKTSAATNPTLVVILLKLSCFPETIKNYGASLLQPIKLLPFTTATLFHGGTFSALWTYLGVDTAKRLEDSTLPADRLLGTLLTLALINGIVVSPLSMGVWMRNLRMTAEQNAPKKKALGNRK